MRWIKRYEGGRDWNIMNMLRRMKGKWQNKTDRKVMMMMMMMMMMTIRWVLQNISDCFPSSLVSWPAINLDQRPWVECFPTTDNLVSLQESAWTCLHQKPKVCWPRDPRTRSVSSRRKKTHCLRWCERCCSVGCTNKHNYIYFAYHVMMSEYQMCDHIAITEIRGEESLMLGGFHHAQRQRGNSRRLKTQIMSRCHHMSRVIPGTPNNGTPLW